jgi:hypothetical protein
MLGLVATFFVFAPLAALAGGGFANGLARHVQQAQRASERQVTATTMQPAVGASASYGQAFIPVKARWTAPDGKPATGWIPATLGTPAGTREHLWTGLNGQVTAPPLLASQVTDLTRIGAGASIAAAFGVLVLVRTVARHELNRRRFAAWDADWLATNPQSSWRK